VPSKKVRFTVTVEPEIHEAIQRKAERNRRSMTSQINHDLAQLYGTESQLPVEQISG
jgi:hypothetical protein